MAYEYLNETTFTRDLQQQEEMLNYLQSSQPSEQEDYFDSDLVQILTNEIEQDDEVQETPVEESPAQDVFDFDNQQMDDTDNELLSFLFQREGSQEGAGTLSVAQNQVPDYQMNLLRQYDPNTMTTDISWLKTKSDKVKLQNLGTPLSKYLNTLPQALREKALATSGNDQKHVENSRHYKDKAIDLRYNKELYDYILKDPIRKQMGLRLLDPNHGNAPHIHLDYQYGGKYEVPKAKSGMSLKRKSKYQNGGTLYANDEQTQRIGLNNPSYNQAYLNLTGNNTIRGLDNYQPVAVTDGKKYKVLTGPKDKDIFNGKVYEVRL